MPKKTNLKPVIKAAEVYVKKTLEQEGTGHDWFHINRVRTMAVRIAKEEKVNVELVELMALLHEMADWKLFGHKNEAKRLKHIDRWLAQHKVSKVDRDHIIYVIANQSYSASGVRKEKLTSPEGRVMQDADRLDAIGAIGIARVVVFGAKTGRQIHDPSYRPHTLNSTEQIRKHHGTSIGHFYEKLLRLKDLMNTKTGKKLARGRHAYMQKYLKRFLAEWDGKK